MADFNKRNIKFFIEQQDVALVGLVECEKAARNMDKIFQKCGIDSKVEELVKTTLKCYILYNECEKLLKIMEED